MHIFGLPNDEAISGHPLAKHGLKPYSYFEVMGSSLIKAMEKINKIHPSHNKAKFMEGKRHFVFSFHDSLFECVAHDFTLTILEGTSSDALEIMTSKAASQ